MVDFGVKISRKRVFFKVSSYSYTRSAPDASCGGFSKTIDPTHEHRMCPRTNAPCFAKNIGPQKEEALIGATGNVQTLHPSQDSLMKLDTSGTQLKISPILAKKILCASSN